jgi:hypothetical protein
VAGASNSQSKQTPLSKDQIGEATIITAKHERCNRMVIEKQ